MGRKIQKFKTVKFSQIYLLLRKSYQGFWTTWWIDSKIFMKEEQLK